MKKTPRLGKVWEPLFEAVLLQLAEASCFYFLKRNIVIWRKYSRGADLISRKIAFYRIRVVINNFLYMSEEVVFTY